MTIKLMGAILIIAGCSGFGLTIVKNHRYEVRTLRQLCTILDYISCELQYHLTPLPEMCRRVSNISHGCLQNTFSNLAVELENQISPNVAHCMDAVLRKNEKLPPLTVKCLKLLGKSLGHFDVEGQIKGLESVHTECRRLLETCSENQSVRLRSYQTLALCAGAAMAILFV